MTAAIILAAGSSSRLGRPKQNVIFRGKTLLQHAVETALTARFKPVVVVLGANERLIKPTLISYPVTLLKNDNWESGMASSIVAGIDHVKDIPGVDACVLLLSDQPLISTSLLINISEKHMSSAKGIIASGYNDTEGPPALFEKKYFHDLLTLTGNEGAKKLFAAYADDTSSVPFADGHIDIDTAEDLERLKML